MKREDSLSPKPRRILSASKIAPKPIDWLWPGWLPWGKVGIWEGDPDVGKSLVTVDLVARVTRGDNMPDGAPGEDAAALFLCAEDDLADTVQPRLVAAGANLHRVGFPELSRRNDASDYLTFPSGLEELHRLVERAQRLAKLRRVIVVIDPITAFLDDAIDANKDSNVRRITTGLAAIANQTGCTFIQIRHLNKSVQQGSAKYRGSGSVAWGASARFVSLFGTHPKDPDRRVMASTKNNLAARRTSIAYRLVALDGAHAPIVEWLGNVNLSADDLVKPDARSQSPQRDVATDLLRRLLDRGDGQVDATSALKAAREVGISESSMKRAADELGLERQKQQASGGRLKSVWVDVPASVDSAKEQP